MPNCTEEIGAGKIDFGRVGRRVVEGRFDGGSMTSDGGVMLLGATDRKLGLLDAAARCEPDPRNPLLIKHAVRDMLRQRVYGLALGWEDLSDHGTLREDVAMQTAIVAAHATTPGMARAKDRVSGRPGLLSSAHPERLRTRRCAFIVGLARNALSSHSVAVASIAGYFPIQSTH